ncbi:hypothetical protein AA309_13165 [Microvirga vignae]|uniref:Putative Flp pilus-assembly TadG-like N-terminal domain-containing protein n=1 Tax=Microvirga vignae TaxID=1225564 RepID=A0A0H1RBP1_9HYPH|nr:TadE/TadG family type IV pilus assembly protein [Microvirga vignae]KLK92640.1 hypothetical protein AA309_13165 [Microvirga vignae]
MMARQQRFCRFLRRFGSDEQGVAAIYFAAAMPVMIAIFGLSIDLGRYVGMHTELQSLADAAALAAARELDGGDDAIQRATNAARAVMNGAKFAQEWSSDNKIVDLVYAASWSDLAAGNYLNETPGHADSKKAAFVQAITDTASAATTLIRALSSDTEFETMARATAGSTTVACAVQPLFMCLPSSTSGITLTPGMMIRVKEQPGSGWGPGNFGLLDPPNASPNDKQDLLQKGLAASSPNVCYVNALTPVQGSKSGIVKEAFNARFDIWDNNPDADAKIPPGPNNFKGILPTPAGGACVKSNPIDAYPRDGGVMPRDPCFAQAGGCRGNDSPFGTGGWDATTYWNHHHGAGTYTGGFTTRFDVYMAQLGLDSDGRPTRTKPAVTGPEQMGPTCAISKGIGSSEDWQRRVIYAALIDCETNAEWLVGNSTKSPIRNADIGQFFITEPTEQGQEIYLEFVKKITANDDEGKLHHIVQLYPNP